jgi:uncharacterized protein YndB with AHSA1/START domain
MNSMPSSVSHELVLERTLKAPRMAIWRCWTEPEMEQ